MSFCPSFLYDFPKKKRGGKDKVCVWRSVSFNVSHIICALVHSCDQALSDLPLLFHSGCSIEVP